jgi:hypothetical protein
MFGIDVEVQLVVGSSLTVATFASLLRLPISTNARTKACVVV